MELAIYTPAATLFEGSITSVTLPTTDGEITVLKGHIPVVTVLKHGIVHLTKPDGTDQKVSISSGFAQVLDNRVVVLAESVE